MEPIFTDSQIDSLATKIAQRIVTPRWLKLTAAIKYSGYGRVALLNLANEGLIKAYQDPDSKRGDWVFDKRSIDEYRLSHLVSERHKALSIIKSLKAV